jgi:D-beta-D-heptose 7-phosphate kinase/D-beta-D-heptose 1-phosphate adenosyltransferase
LASRFSAEEGGYSGDSRSIERSGRVPSRGEDQLGRAFANLRVLVVGDALLDRYVQGHAAQICREGPVPVIAVDGVVEVAGGAGNTAANVAALGAEATLVSVGGDDADAAALAATLERSGVTAHLVVEPGRTTITKHRLFAADQLLARFDFGTRQWPGAAAAQQLVATLEASLRTADAIIVADYGYATCCQAVLEVLQRSETISRRVLVTDARDLGRLRSLGATVAKPNYHEAMALLGLEAQTHDDRPAVIQEQADLLLETTGATTVVVTLDVDGAVVCERGRTVHRVAARPAPARRATGAGDTFTAALALALAAGADAVAAAEIASAAAAVAIAKPLTATCDAAELWWGLEGATKRLSGPQTLADCVAAHRRHRRRIVFTNGCFDLLHRGHVAYLNRAKLLGDVLIVAVNSDDSVCRLKGPGRPITPLDDRLDVLAALGCVDHVVPFSEDSPRELLRAARPDVYVKGGDYMRQMLPEADLLDELGTRLEFVSYVEDRSTTRLIDLIRDRGASASYSPMPGGALP